MPPGSRLVKSLFGKWNKNDFVYRGRLPVVYKGALHKRGPCVRFSPNAM